MNLLVVDVGGSHAKTWNASTRERREFDSGEDLAPTELVRRARESTRDWQYDLVALGIPCRVVDGRPTREPYKLGDGWVDFDYEAAFERPVRIANDACLQALGAYRGGRMLFVGLGSGVGTSLIVDELVFALELGRFAHDGQDIGDLLGKRNIESLGLDRWRTIVHEVVRRMADAVHAEDLVIGGGEAESLAELPANARRGGNHDVVEGGRRLWCDRIEGVEVCRPWRFV